MPELPDSSCLRVAPASLLAHYFEKRADSLAFYRRVRHEGDPPPEFAAPFVAYHSWLPGFIELDEAAAAAVRAWARGGPMPPLAEGLRRELCDRGWCAAGALPDLDALVDKALSVFPTIQNPAELRRFLDEVAALRPRVVLEIGTAAGGMLYCLAQLAAPDALIVSIDVPEGPYGGGQDVQEHELFATFLGPGQRLECIHDRSFHFSTRRDLIRMLGGSPIDLLLIDGDHSYAGVKADYDMYQGLVAPGGLIALHDITMLPDTWGRGFDVGIFWQEMIRGRRVREIVDPLSPLLPPPLEQAEHWGMPALGFGLITV